MEIKEKIQDIEGFYRFIITISFFLLTFINIFYSYAKASPEELSNAQFKWLTAPIILLIGYIIFRTFRKRYEKWVLVTTEVLLSVELVSLVTAISVTLVKGNHINSYSSYYLLASALWAVSLTPIAIAAMVIGGCVTSFFSKNRDSVCL